MGEGLAQFVRRGHRRSRNLVVTAKAGTVLENRCQTPPREAAMSDEADQTRRWLINASGAAILSGPIPASPVQAAPAPGSRIDADAISPATAMLADYVARTLD